MTFPTNLWLQGFKLSPSLYFTQIFLWFLSLKNDDYHFLEGAALSRSMTLSVSKSVYLHVMSFLFSQQLENDLFLSQRTEGSCLIHLVFQSGPKWPMTRRCVHCALRGKERIRWAKERCVRPGGRVQPWPLLGDRQKKAQHVHWSEREKKQTLNGFRLCNRYLIIDHHRVLGFFLLLMNL